MKTKHIKLILVCALFVLVVGIVIAKVIQDVNRQSALNDTHLTQEEAAADSSDPDSQSGDQDAPETPPRTRNDLHTGDGTESIH